MPDRESQRRQAFRDWARSVDSQGPAVALTALSDLCIVRGCLCLKQGPNLCRHHMNPNDPEDNQCHPT